MFRPRVIPVLLIQDKGLVKSVQFKKHKYIGDPINAVKIFNDLKADELVFLDIEAYKEKRCVSEDFVKKLAEETNMPFAVGGGITTCDQIQRLISAGAEKVVLGEIAATIPNFIKEAVDDFGSSTISVCVDVKKSLFGKNKVHYRNGAKSIASAPTEFAKQIEKMGAGEIILQSIDRDGKMEGYDIDLTREISEAVTIPVVALGGAGELNDLGKAYLEGKANALAAGSFFVYQSKKRGVLINYPEKTAIKSTFRL